MVYYEKEDWLKCKKSYELSLELNYNQPEVLNNLSWLLLTSENKKLRDPKKALKLALDAVKLRETHYTLDTLAEAYYANSNYREALATAKKALEVSKKASDVTPENQLHYKKQLKKMKEAFLNESSMKI